MYKAILIDDEFKVRHVLQLKLEKFCPEIEIIGLADDAATGFNSIVKLKPDVVFLDISMPGGSGFDMLEKFEEIDFEIIFVTGYHEYALDALKVSAVDYILKPIQTGALTEAVEKAVLRLENKDSLSKYNVLKHNLNNVGSQDSKIAIPGSNAYEFVIVKDIIRCEGWQKYTKIFLSNGDTLISSYNIGVFIDMLENYDFFSTHKSHLVNKSHIVRYLKDGTIIMSDDSSAPVSRRRKDTFIEQVVISCLSNSYGNKQIFFFC